MYWGCTKTNWSHWLQTISANYSNGWWSINDVSYYVNHNELPHFEAMIACLELGAPLAVPEDQDELDFIDEITPFRDVWLGITDKGMQGWGKNKPLWKICTNPFSSAYWQSELEITLRALAHGQKGTQICDPLANKCP